MWCLIRAIHSFSSSHHSFVPLCLTVTLPHSESCFFFFKPPAHFNLPTLFRRTTPHISIECARVIYYCVLAWDFVFFSIFLLVGAYVSAEDISFRSWRLNQNTHTHASDRNVVLPTVFFVVVHFSTTEILKMSVPDSCKLRWCITLLCKEIFVCQIFSERDWLIDGWAQRVNVCVTKVNAFDNYCKSNMPRISAVCITIRHNNSCSTQSVPTNKAISKSSMSVCVCDICAEIIQLYLLFVLYHTVWVPPWPAAGSLPSNNSGDSSPKCIPYVCLPLTTTTTTTKARSQCNRGLLARPIPCKWNQPRPNKTKHSRKQLTRLT